MDFAGTIKAMDTTFGSELSAVSCFPFHLTHSDEVTGLITIRGEK